MKHLIKKASLEDLDETAELFNLYRIFLSAGIRPGAWKSLYQRKITEQ